MKSIAVTAQLSVAKTLPSSAGAVASITGQGAKTSRASWPKNQNAKQKHCCNRFNKNFKNRKKKCKNNGENTIRLTDHTHFTNYQTFSQIYLYIHKITKWQAFCRKKIKPPIHFGKCEQRQ